MTAKNKKKKKTKNTNACLHERGILAADMLPVGQYDLKLTPIVLTCRG